jgi:hypothetical protein
MQTMAEKWEDYERMVLPASAGPVQRLETRQAFYAGAHAMLCVVQRLGDADVTVAEGMARLEDLKRELRRFPTDLLRGLA